MQEFFKQKQICWILWWLNNLSYSANMQKNEIYQYNFIVSRHKYWLSDNISVSLEIMQCTSGSGSVPFTSVNDLFAKWQGHDVTRVMCKAATCLLVRGVRMAYETRLANYTCIYTGNMYFYDVE